MDQSRASYCRLCPKGGSIGRQIGDVRSGLRMFSDSIEGLRPAVLRLNRCDASWWTDLFVSKILGVCDEKLVLGTFAVRLKANKWSYLRWLKCSAPPELVVFSSLCRKYTFVLLSPSSSSWYLLDPKDNAARWKGIHFKSQAAIKRKKGSDQKHWYRWWYLLLSRTSNHQVSQYSFF